MRAVGAGQRVVAEDQPLGAIAAVEGGEAVDRGVRHREAGVDHAERVEDRGLQVLVEPPARHHLHHPGGDVGRPRVEPVGARVEPERLGAQAFHQHLQVATTGHPGRRWAVAERRQVHARALRAVADARGVHEQVAHGHGPRGVDQADVPVGTALAHAGAAELGQVPLDRILQRHLPLLVESEEGHAGHRLGHRVDAPDRVGAHGDTALAVGQTDGGCVGHRVAPGDDHLAAGDLAGVDVAGAEVLVDAVEAGRVEPGARRVDGEVQGGVHGGTLPVTSVTRRTP